VRSPCGFAALPAPALAHRPPGRGDAGGVDRPVGSGPLAADRRRGAREWEPEGEPTKTSVHDFIDKQLGKVAPNGVYDIAANTGWFNVGTDADTGAFAVESIRRWWNTMGAGTYLTATRLMITADAGGSNGSRLRYLPAAGEQRDGGVVSARNVDHRRGGDRLQRSRHIGFGLQRPRQLAQLPDRTKRPDVTVAVWLKSLRLGRGLINTHHRNDRDMIRSER